MPVVNRAVSEEKLRSVQNIEENGRTYHGYKDGRYMLPNDEIESNRLEMQHKMWNITLDDKLHLAPIGNNPLNVLDIGTGTASWAINFADTYPSARVTGTDLSPALPPYMPSNCSLEIADAEDAWDFPAKFDYIHGRTLATCFKDPASVFQKVYDALLPGGYFEMQDICLQTSDDGSIVGTSLEEWQAHVCEATASMGISWSNVPNYKKWMVETGFVDLEEETFRWPSNQWSTDETEKLLGAWFQAQVENGLLEGVSTRLFMMRLGWTQEKLTGFLARMKKDFGDPSIKSYSPVVVIYGRKPLAT